MWRDIPSYKPYTQQWCAIPIPELELESDFKDFQGWWNGTNTDWCHFWSGIELNQYFLGWNRNWNWIEHCWPRIGIEWESTFVGIAHHWYAAMDKKMFNIFFNILGRITKDGSILVLHHHHQLTELFDLDRLQRLTGKHECHILIC